VRPADSVPTHSQSDDSIEIAVALSLSGEGVTFGQPAFEGIQFAVDEANANGQTPSISLTVYDDQGSDDEAGAIATEVVDSPAWMVLGPVFSTASLAAGPTYAEANMVSLPPTATSDLITQNDTTFRVIFKNSDQGETLAHYLVRVLGKRTASVVVIDTTSGSTFQEGFQRAAEQLDIEAEYYLLSSETQEAEIVAQIAERAPNEPVVFLTLDPEGARMIMGLRGMGVNGPFLGNDAFGDEAFNGNFADTPEQQRQPGYFTQNVYGLAPIILDSANAEGLAFAQRFRALFGHDPVWQTVAGYDAARLAVAAVRTAAAENPGADIQTQRTAVYDFIRSLNTPTGALPGILGPVWFDTERARPQAIRVGRFFDGRFESAPLQIVSVNQPDASDIESGAVFEMGRGAMDACSVWSIVACF
jgi:branched-chain amino acid transport system substrate-binding protein